MPLLIYKSLRLSKIIIFFSFFISISTSAFCQFDSKENGFPPITYFSSIDYKAHAQNFSVIQDKRGVMYFGNNHGILEYDGNEWRVIDLPNSSVVRSLAIDDKGIIYAGSVNELGFLSPDNYGILKYKSLVSYLPESVKDFGDIQTIQSSAQGIYFQSDYYILRWNGKEFKEWKAKNKIHRTFYINNTLYFRQRDLGLFCIKNDSLKLVSNESIFSDNMFYLMSFDKNTILYASVKGLKILKFNENDELVDIIPFTTEIDSELSNLKIKHSISIQNKLFSIGTKESGAIILNKFGNIVYLIDKKSGLGDNSINYQFTDNYGNLWLALENGIARINLNSSITIFNDKHGIDGTIESITRFNNTIYIATNQGVFYLNKRNTNSATNLLQSDFVKLKEINNACWDLLPYFNGIDTVLLIGENNNLFELNKNEELKHIAKCPIWKIYNLKQNKNIILVGLDNGLLQLTNKNGNWLSEEKIEGIDADVREIMEDEMGNIWLGTNNNGLYKLSNFADSILGLQIEKYDSSNALPDGYCFYYKSKNWTFTATTNGFYNFENENKKFTPLNKINKFLPENLKGIHRVAEDIENHLWLSISGKATYNVGYLLCDEKNNCTWNFSTFSKISKEIINDIFPENNGIVWLGGPSGLFRYNPNFDFKKSIQYYTLIRKVKLNNDSLLFGGAFKENNNSAVFQQNAKMPEIDFKFNSINFNFSAPFFENEKDIYFSYILEGNDEKWSEWAKTNSKGYTNLFEGDYVFKIKALNIYNQESQVSVYRFTILPPWYRTIYAYILYVVLFGIILFVAIFLNTRRLRALNQRLEKIIKARTKEIRKQRDEIEIQAKELEKLSIVASETDNSVVIANAEGMIEWVNAGFTKLFEYSFDEFISQKGANIVKTSFYPFFLDLFIDCIEKKKSAIYTSTALTKTGRKIWVQTTLNPYFNSNGDLHKLIAIDVDVTKIKEAEEEIRIQKQEITDSIHYAQRIQKAVLPKIEFAHQFIDEYFILFKPKDIVSGDFYWSAKSKNRFYITAADCTGHGVPGAFMSMLGISFLNEIISANNCIYPGEILNELRSYIIKSLQQKGISGEQKDGMDMAMCMIEENSTTIHFAGANNPLWIVRSVTQSSGLLSNEPEVRDTDFQNLKNLENLVEIKPNKMPVAIYESMESFKTQEITLEKGDVFYIFSDGYPDQFGGPKGKKFLYKKLKELLVQNSQKPLEIQKEELDKSIENWKSYPDSLTGHNHFEQVDDICVIGVRI